MNKQGFIYILTNKRNGTLYVGVTSNLPKRIYEHKNKVIDGFTKKYGLDILIYIMRFSKICTRQLLAKNNLNREVERRSLKALPYIALVDISKRIYYTTLLLS